MKKLNGNIGWVVGIVGTAIGVVTGLGQMDACVPDWKVQTKELAEKQHEVIEKKSEKQVQDFAMGAKEVHDRIFKSIEAHQTEIKDLQKENVKVQMQILRKLKEWE